jgi:hypothetical protein
VLSPARAERTPDVHESMHSLVRFSRQMERRPRRQSAGLPLKHHLPFRARPVVPVCRGRHWLGHSRNRGAACADVSGIASWPEPRSGQTVSSLEIYGGGTTVGGSVLAIIVGRCDSRDCRSKINTDPRPSSSSRSSSFDLRPVFAIYALPRGRGVFWREVAMVVFSAFTSTLETCRQARVGMWKNVQRTRW